MALCMIGLCLSISCGKKKPVIPNEEELITTLHYILSPNSGGDSVIFTFQDPDGDGGYEPSIQLGILEPDKTYTGRLELLNELMSPVESITEEIMEEGDAHQFFFQSSGPEITVTYEDADLNGYPIGLKTTLKTGAIGNNTLSIILRHEPDKAAPGVSDGNINQAGGETDIEVNFDVAIQ